MKLGGENNPVNDMTIKVANGEEAEGSKGAAKVAVITRTRNRPLLLERAARSVAAQTFRDFIWVVVNDGGDESAVEKVVEEAGFPSGQVLLISQPVSRGMEAASNAGIRACGSEYIVIHDDDDSWEPDFLQKTVAFLERPESFRYGGVAVEALHVSEELRAGRIVEHARHSAMPLPRQIELAVMLRHNQFPPIAFLFRRAIWESIGGYDEDLPVLGDWAFNLNFLLNADIGVLPEALAGYHHRDTGGLSAGAYANSVISEKPLHREYAAIVRNRFLRRVGKDQTQTALIAILGSIIDDCQAEIRTLEGRLSTMASNVSRQKSIVEEFCINAGASLGKGGGNNALQDLLAKMQRYDASSTDRVGISARNVDEFDYLWAAGEVNRLLVGLRPKYVIFGKRCAPVDPSEQDWAPLLKALHYLRSRGRSVSTPYDFDEAAYLALYPDVGGAVAGGKQMSGYMHYLSHGRTEGRQRTTRGRG
ncbi:MAG: glycosyltransferase [Sphingomonas sp.]|nr:glycosyltransferase [Sphingomonas sp.]MDX3883209.1 glycosyltransferase [Sphingomonas sp.]